MTPLVVLGCGKAKLAGPAPALELYCGSFFVMNLAYARTLTTDDRIMVLSGRYGLVRSGQIIAPYEQRMGKPGAITGSQVTAQARALGLTGERNVVALVSESGGYAAIVRAIWPHARLPLSGPLGVRMQWLAKQIRKAATTP